MDTKVMIEAIDKWLLGKWTVLKYLLGQSHFWFELSLIVAIIVLCWILWRSLRPMVQQRLEGECGPLMRFVLEELNDVGGLILFFLIASIGEGALEWHEMPSTFIDAVGNLALALAAVRFMTYISPGSVMLKIITPVIWGIAVLDIFGLFVPVLGLLDSAAFWIDEKRISALDVTRGIFIAAILLQLVRLISRFADRSIKQADMSASVQVLLIKAINVTLFCIAGFMIISSMGIDLTSLAVVSGALGVGVGFGLQKAISNFVSGIILLADRSIKPGDVIEVGGVHGVISAIHGRCTSVLTRDGKEYLIPNEKLITNEVINWTLADKLVRMSVEFGVAYDTDIRHAMTLMEEAARSIPRVLRDPAPGARFVTFGESSLRLELRFWIRDVDGGVVNVKSEVMLAIWDAFRDNDIRFPFPQRDIFIKPGSTIKMESGEEQ